MHIHIEKTNKELELDFTGTAKQLLEKLGINPITVIVAADKKLIPLDNTISDAKHIVILSVVSGG